MDFKNVDLDTLSNEECLEYVEYLKHRITVLRSTQQVMEESLGSVLHKDPKDNPITYKNKVLGIASEILAKTDRTDEENTAAMQLKTLSNVLISIDDAAIKLLAAKRRSVVLGVVVQSLSTPVQ